MIYWSLASPHFPTSFLLDLWWYELTEDPVMVRSAPDTQLNQYP